MCYTCNPNTWESGAGELILRPLCLQTKSQKGVGVGIKEKVGRREGEREIDFEILNVLKKILENEAVTAYSTCADHIMDM